jgi:hypothetical protein
VQRIAPMEVRDHQPGHRHVAQRVHGLRTAIVRPGFRGHIVQHQQRLRCLEEGSSMGAHLRLVAEHGLVVLEQARYHVIP